MSRCVGALLDRAVGSYGPMPSSTEGPFEGERGSVLDDVAF